MERYSRQILFQPIGREGQENLMKGRVLLVGCGALGSVLAEILTRAGIGRLTLCDRDYVDESNLQRQSLFTESDVRLGLPKAVAAARHLREINHQVELDERVVDVNPKSIADLVPGQDLILDGTDNFETRYLLNDASLKWGVPWIYGACVASYGLCLTVLPDKSPCLRCILEHIPLPGSSPTCDTSGVIAPIVHFVAALQAADALKILAGHPEKTNPGLVSADLWENRLVSLSRPKRNPDCPACAKGRYEFLEGQHESSSRKLCGRNAVQIWRPVSGPVEFGPIADRLARIGQVRFNEFLLRAEVGDFEIALFRDGRGIVRGTQDLDEAQRVYAKYIGN